MKRSDWYFIGLMICVSNGSLVGAIIANVVMLIEYLLEVKEEG